MMARLRFLAVALLALAFAGNSSQTGRTQSQASWNSTAALKPAADDRSCTVYSVPLKPTADDRSCTVYSLTDMGYDADLGKWIAQTIPEMIEPTSWQQQGGLGVLRYYAPKNILMVKQSAAIQGKVDGFLKELKASLPKASATYVSGLKPVSSSVVPADYRKPALLRTSNPLPEPSAYPVPAAVKPPKHLFHFIIRYEGEGIIDDNVVKCMKDYARALKDNSDKPAASAPVCPAPVAPAVGELPPMTSPPPYSGTAPTVAGAPVPSNTSEQPTKAPKEKKNKKNNKKRTTESAS